ncbi:MAG TPA: hypothetical protein V6D18_03500 [Thermosynechococcaceae cyanobacterium]
MARLGKLGSAILLSIPMLAAPVIAHTVKASGNVGAIFHVEPNHNPKAGQPALVWAALTRRGGQGIPLSQCNCQMAVYTSPRGQNPIARPPLRSIDAEQYRGAVSSTVTFPRAGKYEIELSGSPKSPGGFQPFRLTYGVSVGG